MSGSEYQHGHRKSQRDDVKIQPANVIWIIRPVDIKD